MSDPQTARDITGNLDIDAWATRFELLADPNRLRILHCLHHTPDLCVGDLAAVVDMNPTAVSQALRLLRQHGWVGSTREGRNVRYRLIDDTVHSLLHGMGATHSHGRR